MLRLNVKLLLVTVVGLVSLAAGVHFLHGLQSARSAAALLQQADLAEKNGDRDKAARYLERYLSYAPADVKAQARFGNLVLPEDPRSSTVAALTAVKAFEKALTLDPERKDLRRQVAGVLMKLGRADDYSAALTHIDTLAASEPPDGELGSMRGRCLEELGRYDEAARAYQQARRADPHQVEAYARLAGLLRRRLNRAGEADRVMDAVTEKDGLIAANGRSAEAFLARSRYRKEFNLPGWGDDAARALELAPNDAEILLAAAESALGKGKEGRAEARALLERGVKAHPRNARMYLTLASVESTSGRLAGSVAALERGVKALPDNIAMRWQLADAQVSADKLSDAAATLQQLAEAVKRMPPQAGERLRPHLGYQEGRLLMARGRWAEGAATLETVAPELKASPANAELTKLAYLLLGRCYAVLGNADRQFAAYRQAASIALPGGGLDVVARLGLAEALTARNKFDEAAAEYRKILALPSPPPEARPALARLYINRELRLPESRRRWDDAVRALDEAERAAPGSAEVVVLRAQYLLATGKPAEAARVVRAAREKSPDRVDLWLAEADLAFRAGNPDETLRLIDGAEAKLGRLAVLRRARAVFLARRGGPKAVEALAAIEASAADLGDADRRELLSSLADAYTLAGEPARSRRLVRRLADEDPTNLPLRLVLFDQAQADGDEEAADRLLGEIRRLDTEKSQALLAEASLIIRRSAKDKGSSLEPARRLLGEAGRLRPDWAPVSLAEARIDELQGQPESALGNYLRAIDQGDRSPSAVLRAAQLLSERGRYEQAGQVIQKLQNQAAMTGDQQRMAAELAWRAREYDRALAQSRAAVAADPKDFRNQLSLGRILYALARQGESEGRDPAPRIAEAERAIRAATELARDDPAPRVELVRLLCATGRKPAAAEVNRKAAETARSGRDYLALGQGYEALGDPAAAAKSYRDALAAAPEDPVVLQAVAVHDIARGRSKDAEAALRKLTGLGDKAPRDSAWARRTLALIVASAGDPKRVAEALDLLGTDNGAGAARPDGASTADDRRARVAILAAQPGRARRREAIGILQGMIKDGAATPADRLDLARLLDADDDWPKAREVFQALMASDGKDWRYVAPFALSLIQHKAFKEAETWAARMEQLLPGSAEATEVRARLLRAQGHRREAVALVESCVAGKDDRSWPFARLLESFGEYDAAETLFRKAAVRPGEPRERIGLIMYLARRGKTAEALKLCDAGWKDLPPADVSAAAVKILMDLRPPDETALERVASRLEQAVKANPAALTIRFDLANLRTYQGKREAAEAVYREYFERNPDSAAPLNNIAWLLALQEGKGAEALAMIERAIKMEGDIPALLDTRAMAYLALGKPNEAIRDIDQAVTSAPSADLYFHLARAYQAAGRRDEAAESLRKARELGLTADELHPLERPYYERLVAVMDRP